MRIALIAHDKKKLDLAMFVRDYLEVFRRHALVATDGTGKTLHDKTDLEIELVTHGPDGGDLIIGASIAKSEIDAVIFFRDPLTAQPNRTSWRCCASATCTTCRWRRTWAQPKRSWIG